MKGFLYEDVKLFYTQKRGVLFYVDSTGKEKLH